MTKALSKFITTAERFSISLQLRPDDYSRRFKIRNELHELTKPSIVEAKKLGIDATLIQRVALSAWHYVNRFQSDWFECRPMIEAALVKPEKLSRAQPDKPVTKFVRKHRHKYSSNRECIRAFIEIHGGRRAKLENDVKNDLKKRPLAKSLPKQKKQS
jgi:hypothetical protein